MDRQEKQVLRLIKLIPIVLVLIFFIAILFIVVNNKIESGKQAAIDIKKRYLKRKKDIVKNEVLALVKHINYERNMAEEDLKKELKERVNTAYAISMNIYLQNKNRDKKTIAKMIKDALRPMRFNQGRGYFFIYDMNLKNVMLPIKPEFEGRSFANYQDVHGDYVVKNIAKLCKEKGSTFYTWFWIKPDDKSKNYKKIGYNRYFKPLDWFIGTGEYVVDFESNIQKKILKAIGKMRYDGGNSFFVLDYNGKVLSHIKTDFIGKNRIDTKTDDGVYFVKKIIDLAKKGGGFIEYTPPKKLSGKDNSQKISYVAKIDKWHWVVGSGEYLDDIQNAVKNREKELKQEMNDTLMRLALVFVLIALVLVVLLYFITKKSKDIFFKYKHTILEETQKSKERLILAKNQNKLASMGEMLGNISHQWKQPLNTLGISMSKMILLEEDGVLTKETMLKSFARMEKNIIYLSKTIDVFRDFFKPSENIEEFDLKSEIEDIIYIVQDSFEDNLIKISCICQDEIIIKGDKKKLEQVFLNILNNAKDAIVSNDIKDGKVEIEVKKEENSVHISIQDNALGIPDEIKEKVFKPYFTTKAQSKGTGVGLYMSKFIIVNNFHGNLSFENRDGGARFNITIPLDKG